MAKVKSGINGKTVSLKGLAGDHSPVNYSQFKGNEIDSYGPSSGPLRVIRITVNQRDFIKSEMLKAGIRLRNEDLQKKLSKRSAMILNELSQAALDAVKSKMPVGYRNIESGKLRSQTRLAAGGAGNIKQFGVGSGTISLYREVVVESGAHSPLPYRGGFTGKGSSLAAFLDRGGLSRTRSSEGQGEFEGTKKGESTAWSGRAIAEFSSKKSEIIQKILGKIK